MHIYITYIRQYLDNDFEMMMRLKINLCIIDTQKQ